MAHYFSKQPSHLVNMTVLMEMYADYCCNESRLLPEVLNNGLLVQNRT